MTAVLQQPQRHRVAIVVYSALEGAGRSAIYRNLMFVEELLHHGDDAVIVFDGSGSVAAADLLDEAQAMHPLFQRVRSRVLGVCRHCAKSYGVLDRIERAGLPLLDDDRGHASLRELLVQGRQIITV
ncbi:MAG: DsrE family protein [Burkholderiales bacterium]|nr:DsrE family protein [Burkholderiales bacterium]